MIIQCDHDIKARRPDMIVVEKENNKATIVHIASPWDHRVYVKKGEKIEKYQELKKEKYEGSGICKWNRQLLAHLE